ncbi:MAG: VanZ family protein [Acidobacteriota bacterium]
MKLSLTLSMRNSSAQRRLLSLACLFFALGIIFSSPYIGMLRDYLSSSFGDYFNLFIYILLGTAFIAVALFLSVHIKTERLKRYLAAGAVVLSLLLVRRALISPDSRVALIELIHLAEYGILSLLIFYALKGRLSKWLACCWSLMLTTTVGMCDEGLQWLLSSRVGELRDLAIDSSGGLIGQLFLLLVIYPSGVMYRVSLRHTRSFYLGLALFILLGGMFINQVQRGYWIEDSTVGRFKSRFTSSRLHQLQERRLRLWSRNPLLLREISSSDREPLWRVEDFYLTEARCHTRWRNQYKAEGDLYRASKENLILTKWYQPYISLTHQQWESKRTQDYLKKVGKQMEQSYISICFQYLYHLPRRSVFWLLVLVVAGVPFFLAFRQTRAERKNKGFTKNGTY